MTNQEFTEKARKQGLKDDSITRIIENQEKTALELETILNLFAKTPIPNSYPPTSLKP
jgi:hypothetical protein